MLFQFEVTKNQNVEVTKNQNVSNETVLIQLQDDLLITGSDWKEGSKGN